MADNRKIFSGLAEAMILLNSVESAGRSIGGNIFFITGV
jgi:hypothetical protein